MHLHELPLKIIFKRLLVTSCGVYGRKTGIVYSFHTLLTILVALFLPIPHPFLKFESLLVLAPSPTLTCTFTVSTLTTCL